MTDKSKKIISIVSSVDEKMVLPLTVMLFSLIKNLSSKCIAEITILHDSLANDSRQRIIGVVGNFSNARVTFYEVDHHVFESVFVGHLSLATYYRLLIPKIINVKHNKAIYLDADLLVMDDIAKLWDVDLGDNLLGAVADFFGDYRFNAGVLIYNLRKWREKPLAQTVVDYANNNADTLACHDQQTLNIFSRGRWLPLDMAWNVCAHHFSFAVHNLITYKYIFYPKIIHFSGYPKIWQGALHPYKGEYKRYAEMVGWTIFSTKTVGDRFVYFFSMKWVVRVLIPLFIIRAAIEKTFLTPSREFRGRLGLRKSQIIRWLVILVGER